MAAIQSKRIGTSKIDRYEKSIIVDGRSVFFTVEITDRMFEQMIAAVETVRRHTQLECQEKFDKARDAFLHMGF